MYCNETVYTVTEMFSLLFSVVSFHRPILFPSCLALHTVVWFLFTRYQSHIAVFEYDIYVPTRSITEFMSYHAHTK